MYHYIGNKKIFALSANQELAGEIADHLGIPLGQSEVTRFADGEICMRINETVRGIDVFIIQSTSPPVNDNLMELLIMIDALRRSSAGRITAVMPYFGYARQDRKARSRDPISAKLVADMITVAGADSVLSMDLHCPQLQGFFNIPMNHLLGVITFAHYYKNLFNDLSNVVVVSPDLGGLSDNRRFAEMLGVSLAIVDKRRPSNDVSKVMNFIGDVKGKDAIMLDEVITGGGTITNAAKAVKEQGARAVYACVTHPVLCGDSVRLVEESALEELVVLNTIVVPPEKRIKKLKIPIFVL